MLMKTKVKGHLDVEGIGFGDYLLEERFDCTFGFDLWGNDRFSWLIRSESFYKSLISAHLRA
jgi:hypothetical protein